MRDLTITLDHLLNDCRLERLFSANDRHCALQLWTLQIKSGQSIENHLIYGRLLPYNYSDNSWSFSDNENYRSIEQVKVKVTRLNLYIKSFHCAELLRQLSAGQTISALNESLNLKCREKLNKQFGATALLDNSLVYRPVAYLLNRDTYNEQSLSSPHNSAGAFSASIVQTNKEALFRLNGEYNSDLTTLLVEQLNKETGLDFGRVDIARFGELELLVFPTLNDTEQNLLSVKWADSQKSLSVRFNPTQIPYFNRFQYHLSIENDGQIIYSTIVAANCDEEGMFECLFPLNEELQQRIDSTKLEIFGFPDKHTHEGLLCCQWRMRYVREINFQTHMVGPRSSPVRFDWLEKTTRPSMLGRVKSALTTNRDNLPRSSNLIGGRKGDPWVPVNHELHSLFARLHPPKSEGRFFQRWSMGDGAGRLEFAEWFKALLAKYQQHQIVIFDPYFETAGLGLILLYAAEKSDYLVFTSLTKPLIEDVQQPERVNNLITSCNQNSYFLKRIKLRIYGLKEGRLHDRYILVIGQDKLPLTGFHLSNSFQKAAENFPLLVTPIPADVLLQVEQYKANLVREIMDTSSGCKTRNPYVQSIFDSTVLQIKPRHYESLHFLEQAEAGNVLSVWFDKSELEGLNSDQLKNKMVALNLIKNNSLVLPKAGVIQGLRNCIDKRAKKFGDFTVFWKLLGEALAYSTTGGDIRFCELEPESDFLRRLNQYFRASFGRTHGNLTKELAVLDTRLFRESAEDLLRSSSRVEHLCHLVKYTALTWSEYYSIKILWAHAPDSLITIFEEQASKLQENDVVRLSLLSQIIGEVSFSIQFDISTAQLDCLIHSNQGLLQWMGLNAIERQLEKPGELSTVLSLLDAFDHRKRISALGWMIHRVASDSDKKERYKNLVKALHEALPATISKEELRHLIDSMRGHMRQLAWAEPWLFQDVILPLLDSGHATTEDACDIWMQELTNMLGPQLNNQPHLFDSTREGRTTNIAAFLLARSSSERREEHLKRMDDILKRQRRIVQQPLASTSNWSLWDDALRVSLWILAFGRLGEFYLREHGEPDKKLAQLSQDAKEIAMIRPMEEWQSKGIATQSNLVDFLMEVEERLAAS